MDLRKEYKKSYEFLKSEKKLLLIIGLALISIIAISTIYNYLTYKPIIESKESAQEFSEFYRSIIFKDTFIGNFWMIFSHNIVAALVIIISGVILAIAPIYYTINMGLKTGYILIYTTIEDGFIKLVYLWLPQSIIETPIFALSGALGILGFMTILDKKRRRGIKEYYKNILRVFMLVIVPALLIAAIIESAGIMLYWF